MDTNVGIHYLLIPSGTNPQQTFSFFFMHAPGMAFRQLAIAGLCKVDTRRNKRFSMTHRVHIYVKLSRTLALHFRFVETCCAVLDEHTSKFAAGLNSFRNSEESRSRYLTS